MHTPRTLANPLTLLDSAASCVPAYVALLVAEPVPDAIVRLAHSFAFEYAWSVSSRSPTLVYAPSPSRSRELPCQFPVCESAHCSRRVRSVIEPVTRLPSSASSRRSSPSIAYPAPAPRIWSSTPTLAPLDEPARSLLGQALTELGLSARAYDKIRRVSRTLADLEDADAITQAHIAEAIGYRLLDRQI